MATKKNCFINMSRPCDLTCKAAFEVDDPVDNVDCHFLSLSYHFGESLFALQRMVDGGMGGSGPLPGTPPSSPPKGPKGGFSNN
jgi:hypothetical protein